MTFFFILGILVNALYAVVLGSLIAGCLWICAHLWKDIMSCRDDLGTGEVEDGRGSS